ncbi:MAG TPA: hypothetical protein VK989_01790, partial [Polyangia bacterium]|nr:hypothetical protein [Polyangia bacterium]
FGALGPSTVAWAQDRPSEQDMFGGSSQSAPPDGGAPAAPAPTAPTTAAPPAAATEAATTGGAAPSDRDQSLLGTGPGGPEHLSDYQAPDNPLQIGGQLYLRAQSSGQQGRDAWTLTSPNLLDVYLDARPNPRVRAYVLGRMSFDPTAAPSTTSATDMTSTTSMMGANALMGGDSSGGAFSGGSATGFTTFTTSRGPSSILDQMWIRFDILNRLFVTAGKQHVHWGTGRFWQPTDYLHPVKRNPLDVFDARPGTTMLKVDVPWEQRGWNFYGFGVFEDPNNATPTLNEVAGGARAEIVILGAELGLDALVKKDQKPRYGIDFSTGIWELDIHGDVGIRYGEDFCNVEPHVAGTTPPSVLNTSCPPTVTLPSNIPPATLTTIMTQAQMYDVVPLSGIKVQAVGGVDWSHKYNDNDMFTVGAEYFYNQPGYSNTSVYPGLLLNSNYTPILNFFYTGRQYAALFASFPAPYSWNLTTFTLSTLSNLTDQSFISRLDYSYTLLTHITLEAFVGVHYGHAGGEFRLGYDIPGVGARDPALIDLGAALRLKI